MTPAPLLAAAAAALLAWLAIALRPARHWDLRPVAEAEPAPADPPAWPAVRVLVPARNEAVCLPRTLPALLAQDYPGDWAVVLVDDRSDDGTAAVARALGGGRLTVVEGGPLPAGWAGKVWALAQGARAAGRPAYLLLTDADILHAPGSLRRLVAESEAGGLALNSRMARLRTDSAAERLLVPPFLFFFNQLYPMRLVNRPGRTAAAAGGCVLLRSDALQRAGGFAAIGGAVIDDVALARAVKRPGQRIRLSVSRADVVSLRGYGSLGPLWRMVRRTAFTELRHSWLRLAGAVAGLALLFAAPLAALAAGLLAAPLASPWRLALAGLGAAGWAAMTLVFLPTVRFFRLPAAWALTLPLAGLLYGAMTVDSALRHAAGRHRW
jgi:hopene-associated glycosyltransferase HpnB